ncbi:MAG: cysteine methyltransferase [Bacteroidetes bacterium GWE2_29_8]|nr:MAG: cysteine methyltransferase [Bacteroidetes bacterium GWE2_29_8]OFY14440.1 MAG: cysteine methyltransferase [Bacteroidetes bacterium GWF2_29_10]
MLSFAESVYEIVKLIPKGRVTSYGAIAKCLGASKSARLVGYALNQVKNNLDEIPAHRVVNRKGLLTGKFHFEDVFKMEDLLRSEGIIVENNQIQNFESVFWEPYNLIDN